MHNRNAEFRFYEELNDFLPADKRKRSFVYRFFGAVSVKDAIEAIGVPHAEVDLILVNGESVDFTRRLQGGERVAVYPMFELLDIGPLCHLRPRPLREPRFILDVHLGALARDLRMCGFDSVYRNDFADEDIIAQSAAENRTILTRDIGILKNGRVTRGYWLRSAAPAGQLVETLDHFDLYDRIQPFQRCRICNGLIEPTARETVADRVPQAVLDAYNRFFACSDCGRIYWRGTHYDRMRMRIQRLTPSPGDDVCRR
jgi:uncharacterized protein with PIN domain